MNCATTRGLQGRYRPAVRAAWEGACRETNADPADRAAYDVWYRAELQRLAGISTTKGADAKTLETLCEAFVAMTPPQADTPHTVNGALRVQGFSEAQQRAFNRLVQSAWRKVEAFDLTVDYQAWLNARMADVANGQGFGGNMFDRTMCLFGVIAGDEFWIQRTAEARERRVRYVIRGKLAELSRLTGRTLDWSYVQGIHDQAKLSGSLEDCPAEYLRTIVQALGAAIARAKRGQSSVS